MNNDKISTILSNMKDKNIFCSDGLNAITEILTELGYKPPKKKDSLDFKSGYYIVKRKCGSSLVYVKKNSFIYITDTFLNFDPSTDKRIYSSFEVFDIKRIEPVNPNLPIQEFTLSDVETWKFIGSNKSDVIEFLLENYKG